jgi:hypothetical protein
MVSPFLGQAVLVEKKPPKGKKKQKIERLIYIHTRVINHGIPRNAVTGVSLLIRYLAGSTGALVHHRLCIDTK